MNKIFKVILKVINMLDVFIDKNEAFICKMQDRLIQAQSDLALAKNAISKIRSIDILRSEAFNP